ncbi:hypothetical protein PR202_ga07191 [Eleusine coracana subsp. coracana]|uniref:Uncharacterized protein n=1 Tax=Eleusine coracana subsp. coracana TaxID=191504 RepID=A0AAV5BX16_ELECO|nr:hypothetical protein PR202_ga07191 [Eleusine coracana subsp. coracana]
MLAHFILTHIRDLELLSSLAIAVQLMARHHRGCGDTEGASAVRGRDGFRFEAIPDGLSDAGRGNQDYGQCLVVSTSQRCASPLRSLIRWLNRTAGRGAGHVLAALRTKFPCIYTIGPLGSLLRSHNLNNATASDTIGCLSLWKQDAGCLAWMDTQEHSSVVYVNFGSHTVVSPDQLAEFTSGFPQSGHKFLWSVRDAAVLETLPPAFATKTAGQCLVPSASPPGCPWRAGPGFPDQYTNCKYVCEVWDVGVQMDAEAKREQVAERVNKEVMASEEMRASAARWNDAAVAAAEPGGSSYEILLAMVKALLEAPSTES